MAIRKWMKPGICFAAAVAAISCALMAVDIGRILGLGENNGRLSAVPAILWAICAVCAAYVLLYMVNALLTRKERTIPAQAEDRRHEWIIYLCTMVLITLGLFINYGSYDLSKPLMYFSGDDMGAYAQVKSIIQNGTTLITPLEGGMTGANMFDYPYSDKLSFLIVRCIGIFVKNPYTTASLFYFLNHYLIALAGVWACRKLKISRPLSVAAGVLYGFSPFIGQRYGHLWLTPYFTLPLACLVAIWIIDGKLFEEDGPIRKNRIFLLMTGICFACAFTGLYNAFFACAMLAAATVIRCFREKERKLTRILYPGILIGMTGIGVMINVMPNLVYWHLFGTNPYSELAVRNMEGPEVFALKMTRMLLPRTEHRIPQFWSLAKIYQQNYPLNNENDTAALGIIAAIGFVMSIIMLLAGRKKYLTVSSLNMSAFLIGTMGGLGSFISVFVSTPMRCYNRISLVIMFLSLVMCAMLLEEIVKKRRTLTLTIVAAVMVCVGFFDQTVQWTSPDLSTYTEVRDEVHAIEAELEPGDYVFELPYDGWPNQTIESSYLLHAGYVESENLHWSYGSMHGRSEGFWQQETAELETWRMVQSVEEAGYDGIYLDTVLMTRKYGEEYTQNKILDLNDILGEPLVSSAGRIYFWKTEEPAAEE